MKERMSKFEILKKEKQMGFKLYVIFNLLSVKTAIKNDILDSRVCKKFEGVLNQRRVCKGKKALLMEVGVR